MIRCTKCIMPQNYPGITFNEKGVCNFCSNHKKIEYKGENALKHDILKAGEKLPNRRYDCALGFSGGRDSTYLLYFLKKKMNLKVLAITIDNGFIPSETHSNIQSITKLLNVDLITKKYNYLEKCLKHHLRSFLYKPNPAMISSLCVGCRLGIAKGIYESSLENKFPVTVSGGTPFEGNQFKTTLLRSNSQKRSKSSLISGYIKQILKNIHWVSNPYCSLMQIKEANAFYNSSYIKKMRQNGITPISPFWKYIHWEEKKIIRTIETELNWKKNPTTKSTWRGDCDIALIKLYLYKKLLGFNDKDDSLSDLIRDGQITREDALQRLEDEQFISDTVIKDILEENNIDYDYFLKQIDKVKNNFK